MPHVLNNKSQCPLPNAQEGPLLSVDRRNREVCFIPRAIWRGKRKRACEWGQGLVGNRPDTAGRSLCKAFAEPRVLGSTAFCLTDSAPAAPGQKGGPGSLPLFDCQKP